jgi:hypothetical protein
MLKGSFNSKKPTTAKTEGSDSGCVKEQKQAGSSGSRQGERRTAACGLDISKGGAELPLPALRRQAPRWARG